MTATYGLASSPTTSISAIVLVLALSSSLYVIYHFLVRARSEYEAANEPHSPEIYEDEDGIATEESQKGRHASIAIWIAIPSVVSGFVASILALWRLTRIPSLNQIQSTPCALTIASWVSFPVLVAAGGSQT